MSLNRDSDQRLKKLAFELRDRLSEYVSKQIRLLIDSDTVKDAAEIVEFSMYATLGALMKNRYEAERKIAPIDMKDPRNRLAVEKHIAFQICQIAAERLKDADPGADYLVAIVKRDRTLKKG
jgi:hypothetical protein